MAAGVSDPMLGASTVFEPTARLPLPLLGRRSPLPLNEANRP
jgi:hypothetical protein